MDKQVSMIGFALALTLATSPLWAQQPDAAKISAAMVANQETLREYTWQSRVEVVVDGEEEKVDLYQMRYDMEGELERTRIGGGAEEERRVRGPVRKRVARNKKEDAAEFAEAVNQQLHRYMSPANFRKAISSAFLRMEEGTVRLRSEDVVVQGDSVEFEIVQATRQPMSMHIASFVDEAPVDVAITFQQLRDGPNYPAKQVVETEFGNKELVITTENFNYARQGG